MWSGGDTPQKRCSASTLEFEEQHLDPCSYATRNVETTPRWLSDKCQEREVLLQKFVGASDREIEHREEIVFFGDKSSGETWGVESVQSQHGPPFPAKVRNNGRALPTTAHSTRVVWGHHSPRTVHRQSAAAATNGNKQKDISQNKNAKLENMEKTNKTKCPNQTPKSPLRKIK